MKPIIKTTTYQITYDDFVSRSKSSKKFYRPTKLSFSEYDNECINYIKQGLKKFKRVKSLEISSSVSLPTIFKSILYKVENLIFGFEFYDTFARYAHRFNQLKIIHMPSDISICHVDLLRRTNPGIGIHCLLTYIEPHIPSSHIYPIIGSVYSK